MTKRSLRSYFAGFRLAPPWTRSIGALAAVLMTVAGGAEASPTETGSVVRIRAKIPGLVALTGATVVVSPTRILERATLVLRDGRVEAVGNNVEVPAGATVLALDGHMIYPGFVDPLTEYGLEHVGDLYPRPRDRAPQYEGSRSGAAFWNDAVHPEIDWVDRFEPDEVAAGKLLERGVTAVQSVKRDGVFRGRGFVVALAPGEDEVLVARGAHFASFDKGSSRQRYPSSLIGSIALVRQTLYDARWYAAEQAAGKVPLASRALAALAADSETLFFETEDALSLLRAGRISAELERPFIHIGSQREYNYVDEVAALGQPVVLPLSWPEVPKVGTYAEEVEVSLEDLRHWEQAPSNPSLLASRGVEIAFTASGARPDEDFLANLRQAVARGLSKEKALAGLTVVPARLAGVGGLLGTLEPGRRADFLIADGDLLEDGSRLLAVWVGGRLAKELVPLSPVDFGGRYGFELTEQSYELHLEGKPESPTGKMVAGERSVDLAGPLAAGGRLSFRADLKKLGGEGQVRFTLAHEADGLRGEAWLPDGQRQRFELDELPPADEAEEPEAEQSAAGPAQADDEGDDTGGELLARTTFPNVAFGLAEPPRAQDVLVRGATLWTSSEAGILHEADMLVRDGKIVRVGKGLEAPEGARVLDAEGLHVTPGIVDEHSHLALNGGVNESGTSVSAEVRIADVIDPSDIAIYRALAGGVTTAHLLHGSSNPIGGQSQVIKLRWGRGADDLPFDEAPPTLKLALGENVKRARVETDRFRYPQTRMGVESLMRDAFIAAREYGEVWEAWEALGRDERREVSPPRRDLRLEALLEILRGERLIHAHSYVQSEILMLMRLAEDFGFRIQTFTHVLEGYKVAKELAAHGATASSFSDWWAYKFEVYDAIPYNMCLLHDAGVVTSVNSDSDELMRRLNQEAGKAVLYCGMDEATALRLVTLNSAIQLGIEQRVGSLEVGKDADFVIWNGNPLSVYSRVEETWIEGARYFSRELDSELRQAVARERQALVQKALAALPAAGKGGPPGKGPRRGRRPPDGWHCDDLEDYWHGF